MDINNSIIEILSEILDVDKSHISGETYVMRELDAESIDLLEVAVSLNRAFNIKIIDNDVFLTNLRLHTKEAKESNTEQEDLLKEKYPHLEESRIIEILSDMDHGPVLKVKDIEAYIKGNS